MRDAGLSDIDVLECTARFAIHYPELATAPHTAPDVWAEVINPQWFAMASDVSPTVCAQLVTFDAELEQLRAGVKRGCLREGVPAERVPHLLEAFPLFGFQCAVVERHGGGFDQGSGTVRHGSDYALLALAHDKDTLDRLVDAQRTIMRGGGQRAKAIATVADILGYPPCCRDAFLSQSDHSDNRQLELSAFRRDPVAPLLVENNRFRFTRGFVSHVLCTPDCRATAALSVALLAQIGQRAPEGGSWLRRELSRPFLFLGFNQLTLLEGEWVADGFAVHSQRAGHPSQDDPPFGQVSRIEVEQELVRVVGRDGVTREIPAVNPLLCVPGHPLTPAAFGAIETPVVARPPERAVAQNTHDEVRLNPDAMTGLYFAGDARLPRPLMPGWTLREVSRGPDGAAALALAGPEGRALTALAWPFAPGRRAKWRTQFLALGCAAPEGNPSRREIDAVMGAVTGQIRAIEKRLSPAQVRACLEPIESALSRPRHAGKTGAMVADDT